jgi:ribose 5-phosphate isomerase B
MKIAFASDHAGYKLKNKLIEIAKELGYDTKDFGVNSEESVDYPDYIKLASKSLSKNESQKAVVVCGSGIGASLVANKFKGVRCALCTNVFMAKYSRLHNDANAIAIGERITSFEDAEAILKMWLSTEFEGGRHQRRVDKISEIENL